jgi:hypothetical protein
VAEVIDSLPDESRAVIALFYNEGRSVRQVSDLLGIREDAVKKRLLRARDRGTRSDRRPDALLAQQLFRALDSIFQAVLKVPIAAALFDVFSNRGPNNFSHGLIIDGRNRFERLGLVGGQPDRHRFGWFHDVNMQP